MPEAEEAAALAQAWLEQYQMSAAPAHVAPAEPCHPLMCDVCLATAALHASKLRRAAAVGSLKRAMDLYRERFRAARSKK
jgi:hypothetical protein